MFDLKDYGYIQASYPAEIPAGLIPGRVTEDRRGRYKVICERGEVPAVLKGRFYHRVEEREALPVVGDFALLDYNPLGDSGIAGLLPRRSKFSRTDFSGHGAAYVKNIQEQVVAVNFDSVFILSSLNDDFNLNRISRYLTASWRSGGQPAVLLTKADLCGDLNGPLEAVRGIAGDAPVIALSAKTGRGLEGLEPFLRPAKTIVLLGSSGVGKSSLLNVLAGREVMTVKDIREDDSKGRHTTTHRQLFPLASGALIIDTPGMRELGLWDAGEALSLVFADVEELFSQCRFPDCGHTNEPGCAVRAALEDGRLSPHAWRNYQAQQKEARFVEDRSAYLKGKREFQKAIARNNRGRKR